MLRRVVVAALVLVALAGCVSYGNRLTPSGGKCIDMPLVPFGRDDMIQGRTITRLGPVASSLSAETPAERIDSIRRAACDAGADAVVEVLQQEVILPTRKTIRLSGSAAKFLRSSATIKP